MNRIAIVRFCIIQLASGLDYSIWTDALSYSLLTAV